MDRNDNRASKETVKEKRQSRSRSRSPLAKDYRDKKSSSNSSRSRRDRRHRSSSSSDDSDNQLHRAPPPPIISKVSLQFKPSTSSHKLNKPPAIQIKLNAPLKSSAAQIPIIKPNKLVAKAFNDDSDEEVEEMPAECRMRMRNIGKNTITSSGPNSFGKTKQGFVDSKKIFEKQLKSISSDD